MTGIYIHDDIIAERRVRECRETGATKIDFASLSLTRVPPEMAELTQLTEINLDVYGDEDGFPGQGSGNLLEVPEYFGTFSKLETLNISYTSMVRFPASLENLSSLKNLALPVITHANSPTLKIENFERFLRAWHNLETLSITPENLPALAECIDELPCLKSLSISGVWQLYQDACKIWWIEEMEDKPACKRGLSILFEKLALKKTFTELAIDVPNSEVFRQIAGFVNLEKLTLSCVSLAAIPGCFEKLTSLKRLRIESKNWDNEFTLPESLSVLTQLESLSLTMPALLVLPDYIGSFSKLKKLELRNCGLVTLPESIGNLSGLEQLRIVRNSFCFGEEERNITVLPESFGSLRRLKKLELVSTELERLPESIENIRALEELTLHDDRLIELPASLSVLKSLRTLDLNIKHTSAPDFIGEYPELEELTLCGNNLRTIPDSIGNLRSLKRLAIYADAQAHIPESIGKLVNLEIFDVNVHNGKMESLPDSLANCRSLKRLHLHGVKAFPGQIGGLVNLEKLAITGSEAKSIPASIGSCIKLTTFEFNGNSLAVIPETIGNLTEMKKLDISIYNEDDREGDTGRTVPGIAAIPDSIGNLRNLETLKLYSALFKRLPETIGNLKKLEILNVTGNFNSLPESTGNCVSLKEIEVYGIGRGRSDESVLPASLGNLTDLRSFEIVDCPVKNLPNPSNWKRLRVLELIRTKITSLPEDTGSLSSLQYLNLDGSPVTALPETIGSLADFECLNLCDTHISKFPAAMSNLSKWSELTISAANMTALLESVAALRHLPSIEVRNPKVRKIPQVLKDRDDFYYNGDRKHPRISAELWQENSATSGEQFLPDPLPVRIAGFFIHLSRRVRFAVGRSIYVIKTRLENLMIL
jgi:Leucine-rich repeat (LRR) protein